MSSAVTVSNYYRGFPPPTSLYTATDGNRACYGHMDATIAGSDQRRRPPDTSARRRSTPTGESGVGDGGTADSAVMMESDWHSSGEEEDVSVCSLDVTTSPTEVAENTVLNTRQIEAS